MQLKPVGIVVATMLGLGCGGNSRTLGGGDDGGTGSGTGGSTEDDGGFTTAATSFTTSASSDDGMDDGEIRLDALPAENCDDPDEPNNHLADAKPLHRDQVRASFACAPLDTDLWVLDPTEAGWVEPSVVFPAVPVNVRLALGRPVGDEGIDIIEEVEWFGGGQNDVTASDLPAGVYVVSVRAEWAGGEPLPYDLAYSNNEG